MNKKYRVAINADLFLNIEAKDNIQARNQVLVLLNKYRDELNISVNGMDILEEE